MTQFRKTKQTKYWTMKMKKPFIMLAAVMAIQAVTVYGQDMFRVRLQGTCSPGENGRESMKVTARDVVAQCVGTGFTDSELDHNFALVYNSTADSIQVVNEADGSPVCDVFLFQGGTTTVFGGD